ncbi:heterokaryon incompatibility protein-domain-containing protein [Diaporthe sp. PMI_573]|nr:heterokaryon incompatibility protein-domain-containing protein [Diaporthaceae sp. PMI_573]
METACIVHAAKRSVLVHDEQGRNSTFTDKALLKLSKSKSVARFFADKAERMQRERDGWISFFVPEEPRDGQDVDEDQSEDITRIIIAVMGSKHADGNREAEFILAPGLDILSTGSELPSLFPRGTLLRNTSQSLTELSAAIQTWRQHCHDTHECWKPLAQRRNRNVEYITTTGGGEVIRCDWYRGNSPGSQAPYSSVELPPLELEHGRLDYIALPSRCLEIVPGDDGQCRFWLREMAGKVGKYVILSHRWVADTERVRTLKSNYEVRVGGFDDSEIPPIAPGDVTKVFQEAAQLTIELGIKYLWIDSLCIIQDDAEDWKCEAAKMASYYQNSWLTIVGSSGEGLYKTIDPEILPSIVHLPYNDTTGQHTSGLSIAIQPVSNPRLDTLYTQTITNSEVLSRGWVFQEWLLSTRIAAFSPSMGVFLVCSEDLPQSALLNDGVRKQRPSLPDKSYKSALDLSLAGQSDISESWRRVVEAYSGLNLTKLGNDRLVALTGVAAEFGAALDAAYEASQQRYYKPGPAQYLCGLWSEDLARGLQWEITDRSCPLVRVPGFPSWTWASLGRISEGEGTVGSQVEAVAARWHTQWRRFATAQFTLQEVYHVVAELPSIPPVLDPDEVRPITPTELGSDFGIENRFLALHINGHLRRDFRLEKVWPGGQQDLHRVAKLTANHLVGGDMNEASLMAGGAKGSLSVSEAWHQVTALSGKSKAYGWASFDDVELCVENTDMGPCVAASDERQRPIYAFRLSAAWKVPVGSGLEDKRVDIYAVLFVAEVETCFADEPCFERVGVGRMIENRFGGLYRDAFKKDQSFWLV